MDAIATSSGFLSESYVSLTDCSSFFSVVDVPNILLVNFFLKKESTIEVGPMMRFRENFTKSPSILTSRYRK